MIPISSLVLPILLSAVAVFLISSVIHMATPWHKGDLGTLPDEEKFRQAVGALAIPPGDYAVPKPSSMAEMKTPEFAKKREQGPIILMTVMPNGPVPMGKALAQWFVFSVVVSLFAGIVGAITLARGVPGGQVFHVIGAVAFVGYACALWTHVIWWGRSVAATLRTTVDGLLYAIATGLVFVAFWPA